MELVEVYLVEPLENFQVELPTVIRGGRLKAFHLEEFQGIQMELSVEFSVKHLK